LKVSLFILKKNLLFQSNFNKLKKNVKRQFRTSRFITKNANLTVNQDNVLKYNHIINIKLKKNV